MVVIPAPKSVVDAVQEAETHRMTAPPCSEHQTCWPCACGAHMPTQNALHRHRVRVAADAAWTAAYPAALRDAAEKWVQPEARGGRLYTSDPAEWLRRWADESEADHG